MKVTILPETMKDPITIIGRNIGICYGSDISDNEKNYKRGLNSIKAGHGRVLEFAEVYMSIQEVSARTIRQFYTHIGGSPTRVQESTRYIDYKDFNIITPPKIKANEQANEIFHKSAENIKQTMSQLKDLGIAKEDIAMLLPLGMETGVCCKHNMRNLTNMYEQRVCRRAYQEYRELMLSICAALQNYSPEWRELCNLLFKCKCQKTGYCVEEYSCGMMPKFDNN